MNEQTHVGEPAQTRLYELIWKRTIASQRSDSQLEKTTAKINISTADEKFVAKGEVLVFDGFLKVYLEGTDEENNTEQQGILPPLSVGETLAMQEVSATERYSHHPPRYTEASLVKKLEALGIGRPSTYAPTISTVQKRGYVVKEDRDGQQRDFTTLTLKEGTISEVVAKENYGFEKKKMFPTDIGVVVTDFLVENFGKVLDYSFTAEVEEQFDAIAEGQKQWNKMIADFYSPFHSQIENTLEHAERASGERELGTDPESGKPVIVRIGKFGPMAQIGNTDDADGAKFASLLTGQTIGKISLEEALELFKFPKNIGTYEGQDVIVSQGRFGPYVKFDSMFVSIPKDEEIGSVDLNRAIELIKQKQEADAPIDEYEGMPVQKGVGRFGPFIKWNGMFINVNKKYDFDNLSHEDIVELIEIKKQKEIDKYIHRWDDEGISVQKARWGRFNVIQGKVKIELPKTFDVDGLTLEAVKKMIEEKAPIKKAKKKK
jgi:DNA topoisomerase-1